MTLLNQSPRQLDSAQAQTPRLTLNARHERRCNGGRRPLRRTLRTPLTVIWDRLRAHRFEPVAGWLAQHRRDVRTYLLPPYAPELNAVELIWGYAKTHRLANFAPLELDDLVTQTQLAAYAIGNDESLLRSFNNISTA